MIKHGKDKSGYAIVHVILDKDLHSVRFRAIFETIRKQYLFSEKHKFKDPKGVLRTSLKSALESCRLPSLRSDS